MSFRIQAPAQTAQLIGAAKTEAPTEAKAKEDAAKVGRDFEAILVRQMLSSTKVAGKGGGYADMAIESLATSITSAGGLGMGRAIEQALSAHNGPPHPSPVATDAKKMTVSPQVPAGPAVVQSGE
ncbi:MAG TPA: hypothetical protein VM925_16195 [Labilithrix sp.]|nr:hypothetical protein [Labilithrix sp.]